MENMKPEMVSLGTHIHKGAHNEPVNIFFSVPPNGRFCLLTQFSMRLSQVLSLVPFTVNICPDEVISFEFEISL